MTTCPRCGYIDESLKQKNRDKMRKCRLRKKGLTGTLTPAGYTTKQQQVKQQLEPESELDSLVSGEPECE